ncbi:YbaB/EbfC family nucleoid-associated protein [Mumia sp. zg.B53]|uniref:YbaB/EbfC family nucleoid-associated protein n=1 Tax=Mumia sp. zg.B53 TaxID=2855449 RepID=UPI0027E336B0|nr:YbaB/EbfC family nucleoid-associated protein [Mumia sp. zg.B53]
MHFAAETPRSYQREDVSVIGDDFGGPNQPGGGMPDMSALLQQAQQMQEHLLAAKDELSRLQVTGQAANGLVKATVTGTGELVSVEIKPEAVDPSDTEMLGDMVVAAVRDANGQAEQLAAEKLGPFAGGLGGEPGGGAAGALGF